MRRTIYWTPQGGRDNGRRFRIKEMDAFSCEEWARGALNLVAQALIGPDQEILSQIAASVRDAFTVEYPKEKTVPKNASSPRVAEVVAEVNKKAREDAEERPASIREDAPTNIAAILSLRIFLQLPTEAQDTILTPLLECCEMEHEDAWHPICEAGRITQIAREHIADAATVAHLKARAFGVHADFFTPAARLLAARLILAAQMSPDGL